MRFCARTAPVFGVRRDAETTGVSVRSIFAMAATTADRCPFTSGGGERLQSSTVVVISAKSLGPRLMRETQAMKNDPAPVATMPVVS